ncbi:MAG: arylesterase [Micavibrio aeruginosavorus]|uniref:Arylesterase n=1 Tax=Micavibrio aeruginosavorus TaxID=349221 RepID=A0A2W5BMH0_9BACT|nr:MAG: arylesterase [Micavibrio aeruginosavorus]
MTMRIALFFMLLSLFPFSAKADAPVRIVALGDSLTAGYGLESGQDFTTKLQEALIADGISVKIDNAGVSGDTSAGGLARVDWATQGTPPPSLVIVALGGNDMLRGIDPAVTRKNLAGILDKLKAKNIPVLLAGMRSPTNLGPFFRGKFDKMYRELAKEYDVPLYPFFLEGVAMNAELNLSDGIHPNQKGIAIMVENILPSVKKALKQ